MVDLLTPAAKAPPPDPAPRVKLHKAEGERGSRESIWGLRKPIPSSYRLPFALAMPVLLLIAWCAVTLGSNPVLNELLLPSPIRVVQATLQMVFQHTLLDAVVASGLRILISFA